MPGYIRRPLANSLSSIAKEASSGAIQRQTRSYPCTVVSHDSSGIVTVKFQVRTRYTIPNAQIPLAGSEYIRYPIQPGCKGYAMAADTLLGNMSGLGTPDNPDDTQPGNMTGLVFMPIGNKDWSAVDMNAVVIYGPNGVVIRDQNSGAVITLTPTGIHMTIGSTVLDMTAAAMALTATNITLNGNILLNGTLNQGNGSAGGGAVLQGPVTVVNDLTAAGKSVSTHHHGGVTTGGGNTGTPI